MMMMVVVVMMMMLMMMMMVVVVVGGGGGDDDDDDDDDDDFDDGFDDYDVTNHQTSRSLPGARCAFVRSSRREPPAGLAAPGGAAYS